MRQAQSKKIGEYTFTVSMLPPMEAHRMLTRTVKALGPTLGTLATSFTSMGDLFKGARDLVRGVVVENDKTAKTEDFSWAETLIVRAAEGLDEKLLDDLIRVLSEQTMIASAKGQEELPKVFEAVFQGEMLLMYQWFAFAWSVQYADFFASLKKVKPT